MSGTPQFHLELIDIVASKWLSAILDTTGRRISEMIGMGSALRTIMLRTLQAYDCSVVEPRLRPEVIEFMCIPGISRGEAGILYTESVAPGSVAPMVSTATELILHGMRRARPLLVREVDYTLVAGLRIS